MTQPDEIRCCSRCWHSPANPCHDFVECLNKGPLCHNDAECTGKAEQQKLIFIRDTIQKSVIYIGSGTCGISAGALKVRSRIQEILDSNGLSADIVETGCIGLCSMEPIVDIQVPGRTRLVYGNVNPTNIEEILINALNGNPKSNNLIAQHRNPRQSPYDNVDFIDELPFFSTQTKIVTDNCGISDPCDIKDYISRGGFRALSDTLRTKTHRELCDIIEASGLRDRGIKGYFTGSNFKKVLAGSKNDTVLICNAEKLETGSFMDRMMLESDPFRVIEGIALAAYATGLSKAILLVRSDYRLAISRFEEALSEARRFGFIGSNILDSSNDIDIIIKKSPGAYSLTEDTALLNFINGGRGISQKHPAPAMHNSGQYKSIVNEQLETLANLPGIAARGAEWFRSFGTDESRGTRVLSVQGAVSNRGYVEAGMESSIKSIIEDTCGGMSDGKKLKAVQIGGPFGGFADTVGVNSCISYEGLSVLNIRPASSGMVIMDEDVCMVDMASYLMDFIYRESCGICIPCREGSRRIFDILGRMKAGVRPDDEITRLDRFHSFLHLENLIDVIKTSSACSYGFNSPNSVTSLMSLFRDEFETHVYDNHCQARVCRQLIHYSINAGKCSGCQDCMDICPAAAIKGRIDSTHYIIESRCFACGLCLDICRKEAVEVL